ncbi:hypothetical protein O181_084957 [Austropuccinia psidii MF-1]|uniref:Uncharacterized protein n=1 Tax=Austropuccinia psidii MF-1 TaxID=1389203 RepID=A0A9Q3FV68_9BASI|nr:hypothetical protein [Austropuccinia psidii MF-1]
MVNSRADTTIAQINRISKKYSGIGITDTGTLIKAVLYTRILFGSILWLKTSTHNKVNPILEKPYDRAERLVMGSLKFTPLIFLKRDSELKSIPSTHIVQTHNLILQLATKEDTYSMKARVPKELQEKVSAYPSSIHILIQHENIAVNISTRLEFITSVPTKQWRKLLLIKNKEIIKEEAIDKVKQLVGDRKPQDVQIFMDGSDILDKGKGAEAVIMPSGLTVTRHITETTLATNFELEPVEIKLAKEQIRRELYSKRERQEPMGKVHIFCDNQGEWRKVSQFCLPDHNKGNSLQKGY